MEDNQNYIVEDKGESRWLLPLVGVLVFALGGAAYLYFTHLKPAPDTASVSALDETDRESLLSQNYGLSTTPGNFTPTGKLYLTATEVDLTELPGYPSDIYTLDLAAKAVTQVTNNGRFHHVSLLDEKHLTTIFNDAELSTSDGEDLFQPVGLLLDTNQYVSLSLPKGYREQAVTISPNQESMAYAQQVALDADWFDPSSWEVVIYDENAPDKPIRLEAAFSPSWLSDTTLVYLRDSGVYAFSRDTMSESLLSTLYQGLPPSTRLAVSPVSGQYVLAMPHRSGVSVGTVSDSELIETGRFFSLEETYTAPVFNPAGTAYALLTIPEGADTTTPTTITIRTIDSQAPSATYELPQFPLEATKLGDWSDSITQATN